MSKVTMPHTDRALSAVLWIVAMILMVFFLRVAGCVRSDEPWALADAGGLFEAVSTDGTATAQEADET